MTINQLAETIGVEEAHNVDIDSLILVEENNRWEIWDRNDLNGHELVNGRIDNSGKYIVESWYLPTGGYGGIPEL